MSKKLMESGAVGMEFGIYNGRETAQARETRKRF